MNLRYEDFHILLMTQGNRGIWDRRTNIFLYETKKIIKSGRIQSSLVRRVWEKIRKSH